MWQTVVVSGLQPDIYFIRTSTTPGQIALQGFTFVADIDCGSDVTPPTVRCSVDVDSLLPANKDLVNVGLAAEVTDDTDEAPTVEVFVFSNEDERLDRDGDFEPDATDIGLGTLNLRAESRHGNGRVYLIAVLAIDAAGNVGYDCCSVVVPHEHGKKKQKGKKGKKKKKKDHKAKKKPPKEKDHDAVEKLAELAEFYWLTFEEPPPAYFAIGEDF